MWPRSTKWHYKCVKINIQEISAYLDIFPKYSTLFVFTQNSDWGLRCLFFVSHPAIFHLLYLFCSEAKQSWQEIFSPSESYWLTDLLPQRLAERLNDSSAARQTDKVMAQKCSHIFIYPFGWLAGPASLYLSSKLSSYKLLLTEAIST